ncbi:MAG: NUDIX domain-containing protein [Gammaproteobacteria bacterium]
MQTLSAQRTKYGAIYVAPEDLPPDPARLTVLLDDSLAEWHGRGIPAIWLAIPREHGDLIPVAVAAGFEFHHCSRDLLVLTRRLDPAAVLPHYASHTVGVGAVVLSKQREVLTVLERNDAKKRPDYWKLPGGMLEPGEHVAAGAVREIREETAVETRFDGILGMRHHHRGQFGTSNLYIVCRLTPLAGKILVDGTELADARWMPVEDFLANPGVGPLSRRAVETALAATPLQNVTLPDYMDGPASYEVFFSPSSKPPQSSPDRDNGA